MTTVSVAELFARPALRDRVALIFGEQRLSYGDTAAEIERVAAGLYALGIRNRDIVAIHLNNNPQFIHTVFACWWIGAIPALVATPDSGPRLVAFCRLLPASYLIIDEPHLPLVAPVLDQLGCPVIVSSDPAAAPPQIVPWSTVREPRPAAPRAKLAGSDVMMMLRTSGTTASPKSVWHSLAAVEARLRSHLACPPMFPEDVICPLSPLGAVALNITALPALAVGAPLVLFTSTDGPSSLDEMVAAGGTFVLGGPMRLQSLISAAQARPELVRRLPLRLALTGGDKATVQQRRTWEDLFGVPLLEGYGLTETLGGVIINKLDERDHAENVGTPFPGAEIRIVGDDGVEVPDGTPGELWCRSDYMFGGYWNDPMQTRSVMAGDWYKTGDRAVRERDGRYRILGRLDFVIMRGAHNVSPLELESLIAGHPAIADCMVSGFASSIPGLSQEVEVFLVLREGVPKPALDAYLLERCGRLACPSRIWTVAEIPHTDLGKVDRKGVEALRARATLLTE